MVLTELVLLAHSVDELTRAETLVERLGEFLRGTVEGTTEARTNGQQTRDQSRDKILAGTSGDDGVHSTRNGRTVVGSQHEHHLQELASVSRETATEPQQRHDTADTDVLTEDIRDGHTSVQQLLATVVGDGGDEGSRLTDKTEFLGPGVVHGDLRSDRLGSRVDGARRDELLVESLERRGHVLEGLGDVEASVAHILVLHDGCLELRVG